MPHTKDAVPPGSVPEFSTSGPFGHMNQLFVVISVFGTELVRIPVASMAEGVARRDEIKKDLQSHVTVIVERTGNIDLGMPDGLTRDEREEIDQ